MTKKNTVQKQIRLPLIFTLKDCTIVQVNLCSLRLGAKEKKLVRLEKSLQEKESNMVALEFMMEDILHEQEEYIHVKASDNLVKFMEEFMPGFELSVRQDREPNSPCANMQPLLSELWEDYKELRGDAKDLKEKIGRCEEDIKKLKSDLKKAEKIRNSFKSRPKPSSKQQLLFPKHH